MYCKRVISSKISRKEWILEIRFEYILEKTQMDVVNSFLNLNFSTFHPKTSLIDWEKTTTVR